LRAFELERPPSGGLFVFGLSRGVRGHAHASFSDADMPMQDAAGFRALFAPADQRRRDGAYE
jgi:hypothetical protein